MLRLSTKGEYGVRAMVEVAKGYPDSTMTIREIAKRQDVSVPYLEQILNTLRRAGLIRSVKGPGGGYQLADDPARVNIGQILRALEGPIAITSCMDPEGCSRIEGCVTSLLWRKLGQQIEDFLGTITLERLVQEEQEMLGILGPKPITLGRKRAV